MTKQERLELLRAVGSGKLSEEDAEALLEQAGKGNGEVKMRVSKTGCVSFFGLPGGNVQYGTHVRRETLEWYLANRERVEGFIKENAKVIEERSAASKAVKDAAKKAA